jgi:hypothetical protein
MPLVRSSPKNLALTIHRLVPTGQAELTEATILVSSFPMAAALQRSFAEAGSAAGIRFFTPLELAGEILLRRGVPFRPDSWERRAWTLEAILSTAEPAGRLRYFPLEQLREGAGYVRSLVETLRDLETAGLEASDLEEAARRTEGISQGRFLDLAFLWRAIERRAHDGPAPSWTSECILRSAAARIEPFPFSGPRIFVRTAEPSAAETRFLQAIPDLLTVELDPPQEEPGSEDRPAAERTELSVLHSHLFASPEELSRPGRPRSRGPDGTVRLEVFPGVEEEIEAAVAWIALEILEHRTPLERIAVLMPEIDPLAGILMERLRRLDWPPGVPLPPVHVLGGLPAANLPAAAPLRALFRALLGHLQVDSMIELTPWLRRRSGGESDRERLGRSRARSLLSRCGTLGGSPARAEWSRSIRRRVEALRASGGTSPEADDLESLLPPVEELENLEETIRNGASLIAFWPRLRAFLDRHVFLPEEGRSLPARLDEAVEPHLQRWEGGALRGERALRAVFDRFRSLRAPVGTAGEPRIRIGTIASASGLSFDAVRVIGLSEGRFPRAAREDAILPDLEREALERALCARGPRLPRASDAARRDRDDFHRIVCGTVRRIVFSAPLESQERQSREPSGIFLDVAAALWRPDAGAGPIPTVETLRRVYLSPSPDPASLPRRLAGFSRWAETRAVAGSPFPAVPPSWRDEEIRMRELLDEGAAGPLEGLLDRDRAPVRVPGLHPDTPISASRLTELLTCPHRFLFKHLLKWEEPDRPPSGTEIDPAAYGTLFHKAAKGFFETEGVRFSRREGDLEELCAKAHAAADRAFDEFLLEHALVERVRDAQRDRLKRNLANLLRWEWKANPAPREFLGVERPFGSSDAPVSLPLASGIRMWISGCIDRVEGSGRGLEVTDLKTGGAHPRQGQDKDPNPLLDLQLAVYARALEEETKRPIRSVRYLYETGEERTFADDYPALRDKAERWLETAFRLLSERLFPRTPDPNDCSFCPFQTVCGSEAAKRSAARLQAASGTLRTFWELRS